MLPATAAIAFISTTPDTGILGVGCSVGVAVGMTTTFSMNEGLVGAT